eukprot:Skav217976  [mRNA]  locus=scaffold496:117282:131775:- [translate_table: standard]
MALCCIFKATAFTGSAGLRRAPVNVRESRSATAALPLEHGDLMSAMTDASTMMLADDLESIPAVAFGVSIFVGIVGYSTWTAFGPGWQAPRLALVNTFVNQDQLVDHYVWSVALTTHKDALIGKCFWVHGSHPPRRECPNEDAATIDWVLQSLLMVWGFAPARIGPS